MLNERQIQLAQECQEFRDKIEESAEKSFAHQRKFLNIDTHQKDINTQRWHGKRANYKNRTPGSVSETQPVHSVPDGLGGFNVVYYPDSYGDFENE